MTRIRRRGELPGSYSLFNRGHAQPTCRTARRGRAGRQRVAVSVGLHDGQRFRVRMDEAREESEAVEPGSACEGAAGRSRPSRGAMALIQAPFWRARCRGLSQKRERDDSFTFSPVSARMSRSFVRNGIPKAAISSSLAPTNRVHSSPMHGRRSPGRGSRCPARHWPPGVDIAAAGGRIEHRTAACRWRTPRIVPGLPGSVQYRYDVGRKGRAMLVDPGQRAST